ncbi:cytochrome P450 monooxygenase [Mycobacterium kubicae]|uniref:Cytochrome P450 n=1 Tax=Mycobacterium kubicae TaxID=120959 RepID=A0AAX1JG10_9MYCO|nr:cytochrome P450 [Mycobacterium kubicae]MCV7095788.1 cytochrome P450 [Mycobacterium kubicae]ORV99667.1 cytochrome [Mycobacterium kubicae]QNI11161.1 cytochrome P450 [Mycobacterium kubicae]QPI39374.1 cytochrome P450 [Mycobacterium kubicae]GFG63947.1 cytochrome P450 monooxygenase [Mycobacterium kubicae]
MPGPVAGEVADTEVYYDPYDVNITADPYPTFARLRDEAPLYYNERYNFWAISRHADVEKALSDWETFSNTRSDILELVQSKFDMPPGVMMFEDPPTHTMLRGVMSRVFTPRRMAAIEDQIRAYCVRCLDPLVGTDGFDIIAELASMMPMRVIGMLLGIPEADQIGVRDANDANLRTKPGTPMKVADPDAIADGRIYAEYVDWRAKNPSDDLMTALLNVEFEDENGVTRKLTRKEVLHYTQVVAGAGNETTGRLIGWLAKVLAEHPHQRREVAQDRSLLTRAVDETLRFEPTGPHVARYTIRDFEAYGTTVPAGSAILLLFGAANRDPLRYNDPDTFNLHRDNISHLTFGKGVHYCLGANLARLEGRVALDELLNRWPDWDVDYDSLKLAPTSTVRGWERLRIVV